jgi:hypothetical protein
MRHMLRIVPGRIRRSLFPNLDRWRGTWSVTERYEPDKHHRESYFGHSEEAWRRGPGGFTLIEELHANGEWFGMTVLWWDKAK